MRQRGGFSLVVVIIIHVAVAIAAAIIFLVTTGGSALLVNPAFDVGLTIVVFAVGLDNPLTHNAVVRRAIRACVRGLTVRVGNDCRHHRR
ncbi:hypothetical protein MES4922_190039 [Mesorhizobium ventifaucium]|uniref:Uncharacterized protein n=1 Tax=Mesorhizobium ventifaucium TaxID=666020 RepID=A0ABM9DKN6_9HYPH|nr:hypothetical protein MES4922_190039 [Mesorhizobium ventifaucium]